MKKNLSFLLALTLVCTSLVMGGCGSQEEKKPEADQQTTPQTTQTTQAVQTTDKEDTSTKREQVLNVPFDSEPDSLDLARVSDSSSATVASQIIEGLTSVVTVNGADKAEPCMAESWDVSDDQLTWTFHLRDAQWADGVPVKAQDFVYGITRVLNPETASPISANIKFIKNAMDVVEGTKPLTEAGIKAIDDKTLEIQLDYPVPYFLEACAGTAMFPVRQDLVEKYGTSYGTEADKIVGNGPFVLDEWIHTSSLSFSKNPTYWNADAVKLEKLNFKIISEAAARVGEFENGGLDYVSADTAEWIEQLESSGKYVKETINLPRTQYIFFNQEVELFSNAKVRQAFSIALDREEIQRDISQNLEKAAYGWIPPSMALDGTNFRDLAGEPVQELIAANPDPKALLIEGLKELGMDEDPSKITIQLMCRNTTTVFAEYLQHNYNAKLGVNIELDPVEWPVFQERNRNLDYEMGYKSYGADFNDPSSMMDLWITGTKTVPTAWSSPTYDELLTTAEKSIDKELRAKNFVEAERIVLEEATIIPYAYSTSNIFYQPYVKNIMNPQFTATLFKYAYIEE